MVCGGILPGLHLYQQGRKQEPDLKPDILKSISENPNSSFPCSRLPHIRDTVTLDCP